ncbi:oligopeptide ABC transporter substrate-binding protein OppA [Endozoicomonas sp. OPT23]|uniref:peptide ABC transporter substrate-binding protein n=1 Tax=Endozoicomonas sp. OPT23 TaxID=2072845 RepID=UPI00129B7264|nr:peptide ABC transporter substrate-binding protein [Endozoicomonas sp. OPT23]MRI33353.1 oligopeptide ABC transporter substrate-binding protein OppA [Endozoicomonas sp. OPT23]
MKKPSKALKLAGIPALTLAAAIAATTASAAIVPAGTQLSDVQEITRGNGAEPASLDPQKVEGTPGSRVTRDMFEGLVTQDLEGNTIPAQAESWNVSADNKVFTFKLRKDAVWSNGEPVTAGDFVFAFQRAVDPVTASNYAWYMKIPTIINASNIIAGKAPVDSLGVKAVDDKTFQVTLEKAVPYFIKMLAHQTTFPVPKKVVEKFGADWTKAENIVSNGAFVMDKWVVNERIVLKRNTKYWNDKETVLDQVTFLPIASQTAELNRYKAGELDLTNEISSKHFVSLQKEIPGEIKITPQLGTYYYEFNTQVKPFDDVRVRKALSYAINRDAITKSITKKGELPAYAFTPEAVAGFTPPATDYSLMTQKERNKKAKELLEAAGYNKSNPLKLNLLYNTSESHKDVAVAVSYMWKSLGVQTTLENQEWKTFLDTKNEGKFEVSRAGWIGDYNEPSTMLDLKTTGHGNNDGKWYNKRYDQIMAESRLVSSDEKRVALYEEAEKILAEEMPIAPIYQYVTHRMVKPWVGGYTTKNVEDNIYSRDLYIKKH